MPNPNFIGLFADGPNPINSLAQQQYEWSARNDQVDSANLARQAAAQQAWREQANQESQTQNANAALQAKLQQEAQDSATRAHTNAFDDAFKRYQFGVQTDLTKNDQRINEAHYKWVNDQKDAQEKKFTDSLDESAKFNAVPLQAAREKLAAARDAFSSAEKSMLTEAGNQKSKLDPVLAAKLVVDKSGGLVPTKLFTLSPTENAAVEKANAALAESRAAYLSAAESKQQHEQNFSSILSRIPQQLQVNPDTGEILNPYNKNRFGTPPPNPLAPDAAAAVVPDTTTQPAAFGQNMNVMTPPDATGTTAGTGTSGVPNYQFAPTDTASFGAGVQSPAITPVAPQVLSAPAVSKATELKDRANALVPKVKAQHPDWSDAQVKEAVKALLLTQPYSMPSVPLNAILPAQSAIGAAGRYMWNSGPVQAVRSLFQPGSPDPALQDWIHDVPPQ